MIPLTLLKTPIDTHLVFAAPLMLLTIAPLTLTFPFALATYLFVAHTLNAPDQALGAAMLAGGVTALVGLFCVGLVKDVYVVFLNCLQMTADRLCRADTLYVCYCIDKDVGQRRREEVFTTVRLSVTHSGAHILTCRTV